MNKFKKWCKEHSYDIGNIVGGILCGGMLIALGVELKKNSEQRQETLKRLADSLSDCIKKNENVKEFLSELGATEAEQHLCIDQVTYDARELVTALTNANLDFTPNPDLLWDKFAKIVYVDMPSKDLINQ